MTITIHTDINDARPTSLRDIVGQRSVVEQARVAIDAARHDRRKFDHSMLVGPPGTGKTAASQVIAAEMGTDFVSVLGQSVAGAADLNAVLMSATDRSIVFIDEAHELPKAVQTALYLALDQSRILASYGHGNQPINIPIADFSLLLATTDEYRLLQPLRDRMRLHLRFEFYSTNELTRILRNRIRILGWAVEDDLLPQIARRGRGTPRLALRLLQAAHRVCRSGAAHTVTRSHLERACQLEQLDGIGLGPTEQQYLRLLRDGPIRVNVLATRLGLPVGTVCNVVEPFLIRRGLVLKDDRGRRSLTKAGRYRVRTHRQNRV